MDLLIKKLKLPMEVKPDQVDHLVEFSGGA
jgi:hypothetical protein